MLATTQWLMQHIPWIVWDMGGVTINSFLGGIWQASVAALRKQDGSSQLMFQLFKFGFTIVSSMAEEGKALQPL